MCILITYILELHMFLDIIHIYPIFLNRIMLIILELLVL